MPEHACRDVAQVHFIADEEVEVLGHAQREQISGMKEQCPLQCSGRCEQVASSPRPGRLQVPFLALSGLPLGFADAIENLTGRSVTVRRRRVEKAVCAKSVAEQERPVGADGGPRHSFRITAERDQGLDGVVEELEGVSATRPNRHPPAVG